MGFMRAVAGAAGASLIVSIALAQSATMSAQDFAATAASSDMFEIRSSELALQNAETAAVKEFAQMMIKDHTTASKNLAAAAQQDGVTLPGEMTKKHDDQVEELSAAKGDDFDAAYIAAQTAAHQEALTLMTSFAKEGDAAALKAHAQKTAPIIQMHYEMVEKLSEAQ